MVCQDCSSLSRDEICKLYEKKKSWICNGCKESTLTRKSILVHTGTDDDISDDDENGGDSKYQYTITDVIAHIKQNHNSLSNELKSFKKKLSSLQESIQFMSNSFDELQKENKEIKRWLEEESRDLHKAKKRISELEGKIDSIEQEKTEEIVSSIIGHIGVSIATLDFEAMRISQAANSQILLELNDRNVRNLILKKRKEAGVLKMENCGYSGKNIVYFNEDLTRAKQELFSKED
ncbi:hypothetical protein HHI36_000822 [Cryptolaemus montrouzieri]|uniref:Uncharacterized protein n=1 Tax=Cryptolaemus montrouzieri TaxID=559131 RepID=A0ABD2P6H3_9CUCU